MTDVFNIQVSPGRVIQVQANSPQEAAAGARKVLERESAGYSDKLAQSFGQGDVRRWRRACRGRARCHA